jgi:hypothetical protein
VENEMETGMNAHGTKNDDGSADDCDWIYYKLMDEKERNVS